MLVVHRIQLLQFPLPKCLYIEWRPCREEDTALEFKWRHQLRVGKALMMCQQRYSDSSPLREADDSIKRTLAAGKRFQILIQPKRGMNVVVFSKSEKFLPYRCYFFDTCANSDYRSAHADFLVHTRCCVRCNCAIHEYVLMVFAKAPPYSCCGLLSKVPRGSRRTTHRFVSRISTQTRSVQ